MVVVDVSAKPMPPTTLTRASFTTSSPKVQFTKNGVSAGICRETATMASAMSLKAVVIFEPRCVSTPQRILCKEACNACKSRGMVLLAVCPTSHMGRPQT